MTAKRKTSQPNWGTTISWFSALVIACFFTLTMAPAAAGPLLTGVVEDVNAQTIEMPSLPGAWQRRIEWMAREGEQVQAGDLVVRLEG